MDIGVLNACRRTGCSLLHQPEALARTVAFPDLTPSPALGAPSKQVVRWTSRRAQRFAIAAAFAVLGVSLAFRLLWLDRLPGINGDEAWYGVQILRFIHGEEWTGRTPTGLPINPLLFVTEWVLLKCFEPSFWVLRMPVVLWSITGLFLTYVMYRWVYGSSLEAILVVCLTACLPAHLAYSRFCWDGSFAFVSFPLFVFPLLRFLGGHRGIADLALLVAGGVLTVWVHATHGLLVLAGLGVLAWQFRGAWWSVVRRLPITTTAVLVSVMFGMSFSLRRSQLMKGLLESAASSIDRLPEHLAGLSEVMLGPRVFEYLSGQPVPGWIYVVHAMFYVVLGWLFLALIRWGSGSDRTIAVLTIGVVLLILLAGRTLRLHRVSYERYILYLVPLLALVTVRGTRSMSNRHCGSFAEWICPALSLGFSTLCLVQFWYGYFDPLQHQSYKAQQHRTFHSGVMEPKAVAAALIRTGSQPITDPPVVYVEDWWLEHALNYLLGGRHAIAAGVRPDGISAPAYVVGFTGSAFTESIIAGTKNDSERRAVSLIGDKDGSSVLTVIAFDRGLQIESAVRETVNR